MRYLIALLVAGLVHAAAFWGWCAFRKAHPERMELPTLDLSSVELSFSDDHESEEVRATEARPTPPAEPRTSPLAPPVDVPSPPHEEPKQMPMQHREAPPDVQMEPNGLPIPVAERPVAASMPSPTPAPAPAPARETAQIHTPPAPPSTFRPRYPTGCRRRGEEGTVLLEIEVDVRGHATDVRIIASSGFREMDAAATAAAATAHFTPAKEDGRPVPSRLRLPVSFSLQGGGKRQ